MTATVFRQPASALSVQALHAWDGTSHVLQGVDLHAGQGQVIGLLGPQPGARTLMLHAIVGKATARHGSVRIRDAESIHLGPDAISAMGVGYCAPDSAVFPELSCEDNLLLPAAQGPSLGGAMPLTELYDMMPALKASRQTQAGMLTRHDRSLLAVARLLRTGARLLLLDTLASGLAPSRHQELSSPLRLLAQGGYTILLAENDATFAHQVADRCYRIDGGTVRGEPNPDARVKVD